MRDKTTTTLLPAFALLFFAACGLFMHKEVRRVRRIRAETEDMHKSTLPTNQIPIPPAAGRDAGATASPTDHRATGTVGPEAGRGCGTASRHHSSGTRGSGRAAGRLDHR